MESSAFVPSRLKGGMCPADVVTPQNTSAAADLPLLGSIRINPEQGIGDRFANIWVGIGQLLDQLGLGHHWPGVPEPGRSAWSRAMRGQDR